MNDFVGVQVLKRTYDLVSVTLRLYISLPSSSFDQFIESLIGAQFLLYINILAVLEHMLELYYIGMVKRPVDLDF